MQNMIMKSSHYSVNSLVLFLARQFHTFCLPSKTLEKLLQVIGLFVEFLHVFSFVDDQFGQKLSVFLRIASFSKFISCLALGTTCVRSGLSDLVIPVLFRTVTCFILIYGITAFVFVRLSTKDAHRWIKVPLHIMSESLSFFFRLLCVCELPLFVDEYRICFFFSHHLFSVFWYSFLPCDQPPPLQCVPWILIFWQCLLPNKSGHCTWVSSFSQSF